MTIPQAARPADVTRALRVLFPRPVKLATSNAGLGRFAVTLPATCARELGLGITRDIAEKWLSRNLGVPVTVINCKFPPRRYGEAARAVITITTGGRP